MAQLGRVAALAGRRIDPLGSPVPRFPLVNLARVERDIFHLLKREKIEILVSSGANGADLVAQTAAMKLSIRSVIVIPFAASLFRKSSVTDRPGSWGELFDRLVHRVDRAGDLIVLNHPVGEEAYRAATEVIVAEAASLAAPERAVAIVAWEGSARNGNDATADFARLADSHGFERREVITC